MYAMDPVERLTAIEDIKQLKARYFRAGDTKNEEMFESLFTEDAVLDFSGGTSTDPVSGRNYNPNVDADPLHGIEEIMSAYRSDISAFSTVHHGHMPEIEILSPTTAKGVWAMMDSLRFTDPAQGKGFDGAGHYFEMYEKTDGVWKIKTLKLVRLRLEFFQ